MSIYGDTANDMFWEKKSKAKKKLSVDMLMKYELKIMNLWNA